MSVIDNEINNFFDHAIVLRTKLAGYEDYCKTYESFNYPAWTTKNGDKIKLSDMSNSHLQNTIDLVKRKDPDNNWIKVLEQEKTYRLYKDKIILLKNELSNMEDVMNMVF